MVRAPRGRSNVDAISGRRIGGDGGCTANRTTLAATVALMALHTRAVAATAGGKFLVADLPFLSFRKGVRAAMAAVGALVTSGAQAIKLEGVDGHEDVITHVVGSGVPVMGHIGLTPQSAISLEGSACRGERGRAARLLRRPTPWRELGCFAIVLECVPSRWPPRSPRSRRCPSSGSERAGTAPDRSSSCTPLGCRHYTHARFVRHYLEGRAPLDRCARSIRCGREGQAVPSGGELLMMVYESVSEWRAHQCDQIRSGTTLGVVPTMGALHDGHLSLVRRSRAENRLTLVTIFVNPTQFDNPDDLTRYPRTLADDLARLSGEGTDFVLRPSETELYPDGYQYRVTELGLSRLLEGAHRPGHFDAVLTVVLKLLQIAAAERAYFGEKDWQQLRLVQGMAEAFFLPTVIVPCATVREADGLAPSSRNRRLPAASRRKRQFYRILGRRLARAAACRAFAPPAFDLTIRRTPRGRRLVAVRPRQVG